MLLVVTVIGAVLLLTGYAVWFDWEFGAPPGLAGVAPPRIRWCNGGETFFATPDTLTVDSVPSDAVWQSVSFAAPYSWRAVPPKPATQYSGIACPMALYLKTDATRFMVYRRSGGP